MLVICFDLDDTLYKEIEYLKSAYREIALWAAQGDRWLASDLLSLMTQTYRRGGNAFRKLNEVMKTDIPVATYLQMYRSHRPELHLAPEVKETLEELKAAGCTLALITDGRSLQQRNKIAALELDRWIADGDILISEETGSEKPAEDNYRRLMERHPDADWFVYVGDNLGKDFVAPNRLGWTTICLEDNGENIHPQKFAAHALPYQPHYRIASLDELKKHFGKSPETRINEK